MPKENNLLKRSPKSRKSLAVGKPMNAPSPRRRRAYSIAGEKIKMSPPRRSILRPFKGILKSSNQTDDTIQNITQFLPSSSNANSHDSTDSSASFLGGDSHTGVSNTTRKSLGGRRVSFAAHAHVRVFETNNSHLNEKIAPPTAVSPNSMQNVQRFEHQSSMNAETTQEHSRRTSMDYQSYSNDQDEEESMELSEDNIVPQTSTEDMSFSDSLSQISDSNDGNMSMTCDFGEGIVSRRQSLNTPLEPRRKTRMRSSIPIPVSANGIEPTDFTVSVDRPPVETDVFKALKAVANNNRPDAEDENDDTDMDVTTAVSRLIAIRNNIDGFQGDDSFSTDDSMSLEENDHTMNMTSVMSNLQGVEMDASLTQEYDEETMSVASVVDGRILNLRGSALHRSQVAGSSLTNTPSQSRIPIPTPVPKFTRSVILESTLPVLSESIRSRKSSVTRDIPQIFNPPKTTLLHQEPPEPEIQRGHSRLIEPRPDFEIEEVSRNTRRPSGYYRKGLRPSSADTLHTQAHVNKDADEDNDDLVENGLLSYGHRVSEGSQVGIDVVSLPSNEEKAQVELFASEEAVTEGSMDPISLEQFLDMTNIRFMDNLTCPRRSTIYSSQMKRRTSQDDSTDVPPLSSYAIAMTIHVAQLETMIWISNDMQAAIEKYKIQYQQTESDVTKDIPMLFREYITASDDDREPILYVLKLIKSNTISSAKANWYEWKRGWIQGLQVNALRTLENLHADKNQLVDFSTRAGETLPFLRAEYASILLELESEQAEITEIEHCDQDFLSELKVTIAEQSHELDLLKTELADGKNKLRRLTETIEELEDQTEHAEKVVRVTQRQLALQKTSTRAEVFRLREELQYLQVFHLWRVTRVDPSSIELLYDSKYKIIIPCRRFTPLPETLAISPVGDLGEDDFPLLSQLMVSFAKRCAVQSETKVTLKSIVHSLSDFWASYFQLLWQLKFIVIKYPLSCKLLPPDTAIADARGFQVIVTLLLLKKTTKAQITFSFNEDLLSQWPNTLSMLQYTVQIVYGRLSSQLIEQALRSRLSDAKPEENHACLVDACMEVVSQYG